MYPKSNELIYDNYNALAFGWSPTDKVGHVFCSVAVGRSNGGIHFGFYWGSELVDPKGLLLGEGKQYRFIRVSSMDDFPKTYIKKLVGQAYKNSIGKVKDPQQLRKELTIIKSVSKAKRAPTKKKA
jgi:hypothetical protein